MMVGMTMKRRSCLKIAAFGDLGCCYYSTPFGDDALGDKIAQ
jgi:hypothetical protein